LNVTVLCNKKTDNNSEIPKGSAVLISKVKPKPKKCTSRKTLALNHLYFAQETLSYQITLNCLISADVRQGIQKGQGETMQHLIDMGVNSELMLYSLNTPPEEIYILVEEELTETRIATQVLD